MKGLKSWILSVLISSFLQLFHGLRQEVSCELKFTRFKRCFSLKFIPWEAGLQNWTIVYAVQLLSDVQLFVTPWTVAPRLLCPWDFPGKNTGVGCHALVQGIFLTQGSNPRVSPTLAGRFFTTQCHLNKHWVSNWKHKDTTFHCGQSKMHNFKAFS